MQPSQHFFWEKPLYNIMATVRATSDTLLMVAPSSHLQSSETIMSIRHFLSPLLRRFRAGNSEMESVGENDGCDDNDIFDVLDDKENELRGVDMIEEHRDFGGHFFDGDVSLPFYFDSIYAREYKGII